VHHLFRIFLHLGPVGLLLLGMADSSFLVLPFGNDVLLVLLVARNHHLVWEYVPLAALGSVIGVFFLDLVARKGGEEGLQKMMDRKRFEGLEKRMKKRGAIGIALACIAPPPFPFTAVIAAASAFQYPRHKLFAVAFVARLVRFSMVAVAAIELGRQIIAISKSPEFFWTMIGFIVLGAGASTISVIGWIRRSRQPPATQRRAA
jgi:membrane protein YqaA with SNARE-associated domain